MGKRLDDRILTVGVPVVSLLFALATTVVAGPVAVMGVAALLVLLLAVFAAVHHAEVIAHETGEPFGTLVLTITVTVIELALIVSVMLGEKGGETLADRKSVV